jgi:ribosomal protein S18 acetylase RimI-like enzyme
METKIFGDKKITIRTINKTDLKNLKKFMVFINSLVEEDAKILMNKKATIKEEKDFVGGLLKGIQSKTKVYLMAEHEGKMIGATSIELQRLRRNHIGEVAIAIVDGYRGIGLGTYLLSEIIKRAKKDLIPTPKIIQLEAYINNKPAISLYKKLGFKAIAKIPKQIQYKGKLVADLIMIKQI